MKKFMNLVIGGIETKVVNLILVTVLLMSVAFAAVAVYHTQTLTDITAETGREQQETIRAMTEETMDQVARVSLSQLTAREAAITDALFASIRARVQLLAEYAAAVLDHPENYGAKPYVPPDPTNDGRLTAQVLLAEGVQEAEIAGRLGLAANLSDVMISLCDAFGADNVYAGLPEGAFLTVNAKPSNWLADGRVTAYDPRVRDWYLRAAEAGGMIFNVNLEDASTHDFCVECAMPVYGADGSLLAVIGADLFRDSIAEVLSDAVADGGYRVIIDRQGHVIYSPNEEIFHAYSGDQDVDALHSDNAALSALVAQAFTEKTGVELIGADGQEFYMVGAPIPSAGWMLLSAFSRDIVDSPAVALQASNDGIQRQAIEDYRERASRSRITVIALLAAVAVLMLASAIVVGKRIVRPLNTITKRIASLSPDDPRFRMEDSFRTGDEIEVLADAFASLSGRTLEYVDEVQRVTAEKERIGTELHMANQIQEGMLPSIFPAYPDRPEFDVYASMNPAKEVGGDFYDFFLIDDDHLCMVMADVSGKGVPAALFMMASKIIIQSCAMLGRSAAEILTKTNEAICSNNKMQMFVTVWLGILEISTGRVSAANAGHEYPALGRDGRFELYRDRHGFVLGGIDGMAYREYQLQMKPGDKLFLYTDGVTEATDGQKALFGTERMLETLNSCPGASPEALLETVRGAVNAFVGDEEQFDDMTMLCLEYKGPKAHNSIEG